MHKHASVCYAFAYLDFLLIIDVLHIIGLALVMNNMMRISHFKSAELKKYILVRIIKKEKKNSSSKRPDHWVVRLRVRLGDSILVIVLS